MSLNRVLQKQRIIVVGLNSGTSADGLDLAAVSFHSKAEEAGRIAFVKGRTRKYPRAMREQILKTMYISDIPLDELMYLDNVIGHFFGKEAAGFLEELAGDGIQVDAVASHGQTVRHLPVKAGFLGLRVRGTLQLGSPEFIATATGKLVISDFRQADIAVGNEGAPITTYAIADLFGDSDESRLIVNIGGIANYFYIPAGGSHSAVEAADCGPGNSLSDILCGRLFNEKYDKSGRFAAQGKPSDRLLTLLLQEPFYTEPVRSTGKEVFGEGMAGKMLQFGSKYRLSGNDLLATAVELTVRSIVRKIRPILQRNTRVKKLYLTGGGRDNIFLVKRLQLSLPEVLVCRIDDLGIPGEFVEAVSYAVLGEACLRERPMSAAGKNGLQPILGRITQPPSHTSGNMTGKSS